MPTPFLQSGLDYEIPQNFIQSKQPFQQEEVKTSEDLGAIEDANHPLASRGKLTSDYYNNYGQLKQYATSMAKDFGIDVFKPDYTQEGGGEPFKLAQKLQANIMYTANALRNEREAEKEKRKMLDEGKILRKHGVDFNNTLAYSNDNNFIPTTALPGITAANQRGAEDTFDKASQDRVNANIQQEAAKIDQLVQSGQLSLEEGQLQKSYLVNNAYKTPAGVYSAYAKNYSKGSGANTPEIDLYKKYTNIINGAWDYDNAKKVVKSDGVHYINEDGKGVIKLGKSDITDKKGKPLEKIVDHWDLDPRTSVVTVHYTNPQIPPDEVSGRSGQDVTSEVISNNPKFGSVSKFMKTLNDLGLVNENGVSKDEMIVNPDVHNIRQRFENESNTAHQAVTTIQEQHRKELDNVFHAWYWDGTKDFDLPNDKKLKIEREGDDSFKIKNYKDLFGNTAKASDFEGLSKDEVISYLSELGAYNKHLSSNTETKSPNKSLKTISVDRIKSLVGTKGYEGYTEQELIDYYKSQGYDIK